MIRWKWHCKDRKYIQEETLDAPSFEPRLTVEWHTSQLPVMSTSTFQAPYSSFGDRYHNIKLVVPNIKLVIPNQGDSAAKQRFHLLCQSIILSRLKHTSSPSPPLVQKSRSH